MKANQTKTDNQSSVQKKENTQEIENKSKNSFLSEESFSNNPFLADGQTSTNPFVNPNQTSTNPFLSGGAKSVNPWINPNQVSNNPFLSGGAKSVNPFTPVQKKENKIQLKENTSDTNTSASKMPAETESKMSDSFGVDFSGVNIHKDSDKANELNALAFTQGSNIHFAKGQYDDKSQKGLSLLGHELTHVVQQSEGKVQATTQMKGVNVNDDSALEAEADQMGEKAANNHQNSIFAGNPTKTIQTKSNNQPVQMFLGLGKKKAPAAPPARSAAQTPAQAPPSPTSLSDMKMSGNGARREANNLGADAPEGAIRQGAGGAEGAQEVGDTFFSTSGEQGDLSDAKEASSMSEADKDAKDKEAAESGADRIEGGFNIASGLLKMGTSLMAFFDEDAEASDKFEAVLDGLSGGAQLGQGVSQVVGDIQGEGKTNEGKEALDAVKSAKVLDGIVNIIGGIKSVFEIIKNFGEAKELILSEGASGKEKAKAGLEIVSKGVDAGKSFVSAAKAFLDLAGGASTGLASAIPGLGIVLSAIDIIMNAIEMHTAVMAYREMDKKAEILEQKILTDPKYAHLTKTVTKNKWNPFKDTTQEKAIDNNQIFSSITGKNADKAKGASTVTAADGLIKEYELATELRYMNRQRIVNTAVNIGADVLSIIGDILTLSGIGSPAGIALKFGGAAMKAGNKLFDWIRQKYRNSGRGDQTRTDPENHLRRKRHVGMVLNKVIATQKGSPSQKQARAQEAEGYIKATGMTVYQFLKFDSKPADAAKALYDAMKKTYPD